MSWTPEREAQARRLWDKGQSASSIARTLGGVTRVAVIGKLHRMGLGRETRAEIAERVATKRNVKRKVEAAPPSLQADVMAHARRIADREDVRVAEVPYPTSNSGVALRAKVSLLREPLATP